MPISLSWIILDCTVAMKVKFSHIYIIDFDTFLWIVIISFIKYDNRIEILSLFK